MSIEKYFQKQKNIPRISGVNERNEVAEFYNSHLKRQIKKCGDKCNEGKKLLREQIKELEIKCSQYEAAFNSCSMVMREKDKRIEELQKVIANKNPARTDDSKEKAVASSTNDSELSFCIFSQQFKGQQLTSLRSIGIEPQNDSKFVRTAMTFLYEGNLEILKTKSLSGRGRTKKHNKETLSPEKVLVLSNLFKERLNMIQIDECKKTTRMKSFNRLIKDAIANINKSNESNETEIEACCRLTESMK